MKQNQIEKIFQQKLNKGTINEIGAQEQCIEYCKQNDMYQLGQDNQYESNGELITVKKYYAIKEKNFKKYISNNENFYDVYDGNKSMFIIDIDSHDPILNETQKTFVNNKQVVTELIQQIILKLNLTESQIQQVIILESCNENKVSYHIHFIDMYCTNIDEMSKIMKHIKYVDNTLEIKPIYKNTLMELIDDKIYSKNRLIRSLNQTKAGGNRILKYFFTYNNVNGQINNDFDCEKDIQLLKIQKHYKERQFIFDCLEFTEAHLIQQHHKTRQLNCVQINKIIKESVWKPIMGDDVITFNKIEQQMNKDKQLKHLQLLTRQYRTKKQNDNTVYRITFQTQNNKLFVCHCGDIHQKNQIPFYYNNQYNTLSQQCFDKQTTLIIKENFIYSFTPLMNSDLQQFCLTSGIEYKTATGKEDITEHFEIKNDFNYKFIKSQCGSGKTQLAYKYIRDNKQITKIIYICSRITMKTSFMKDQIYFDDILLLDYEKDEDIIKFNNDNKKDIIKRKMIFVTPQSICKLLKQQQYLIVVDECFTVLQTILSNEQSMILKDFINTYETQTLFMDQLIESISIQFYKHLIHPDLWNEKPIQLIEYHLITEQEHEIIKQVDISPVLTQEQKQENIKNKVKPKIIYQNTKIELFNDLIQKINKQIKKKEDYKSLTISCDNKEEMQKMVFNLIKFGYNNEQILLLHGELQKSQKEEIMTDIGQMLTNKKVFLFTPTLTMGSSLILEQFKIHINYMSDIVNPQVISQMIYRSRCTQKFYHITNDQAKSIIKFDENILLNYNLRYQLFCIVKNLKFKITDLIPSVALVQQNKAVQKIEKQKVQKVLSVQQMKQMIETNNIVKLKKYVDNFNQYNEYKQNDYNALYTVQDFIEYDEYEDGEQYLNDCTKAYNKQFSDDKYLTHKIKNNKQMYMDLLKKYDDQPEKYLNKQEQYKKIQSIIIQIDNDIDQYKSQQTYKKQQYLAINLSNIPSKKIKQLELDYSKIYQNVQIQRLLIKGELNKKTSFLLYQEKPKEPNQQTSIKQIIQKKDDDKDDSDSDIDFLKTAKL